MHADRVLRGLRDKGLISLHGQNPEGADWEGLKEVGEFDPTYLHLLKNGRV